MDEADDKKVFIQKGRYKKTVFFSVIILIVAVALIYFSSDIFLTSGQKRVRDLVSRMEQAKTAEYDRAMADTFGGKTPQETLQMYIAAVEKGDYELASKYFIDTKRDEELKSFHGATGKQIEEYLVQVRKAQEEEGEYYKDKYFTIYTPILIDLIRYPNEVWKIVEI